jgi:sterol desaturase/sphingolipid hydroxylase (fatty acid hydroxylase superfamily)
MFDLVLANSYLFILLFFGVLEFATGKFIHPNASPDEAKIELASLATFLIGRPLAYILVAAGAWYFAPQLHNAYSDWPWWVWALVFLVGEDMVQYWWHRLGHTRFGWAWHRAHHSAPYMGVRVTLRNGFLYSFLMPSAWTAALFVYLGAGPVAIIYGLIKGLVTIGAHSELRWDRFLYENKSLAPLAWVVERTISTPATHFSHHALSEADGVGHYSGNFGNLLFFWDVLFGTALITRRYPPTFGVEGDRFGGDQPWTAQMFYPLFKWRPSSTKGPS